MARHYTRRALTGVKQRLKGAKMGYSLLKKKSDALTIKFRAVAKRIIEVRPPRWPTEHATIAGGADH